MICSKCGKDKAKSAFYSRGRRCRQCTNEAQARYYRSATGKSTYLLRRFGITLEQYNAILDAQNGRCAICLIPGRRGKLKSHAKAKTRPMVVDYDHTRKRVRGILCHQCNLALAHLGDDVQRVEMMRRYLTHRQKGMRKVA